MVLSIMDQTEVKEYFSKRVSKILVLKVFSNYLLQFGYGKFLEDDYSIRAN